MWELRAARVRSWEIWKSTCRKHHKAWGIINFTAKYELLTAYDHCGKEQKHMTWPKAILRTNATCIVRETMSRRRSTFALLVTVKWAAVLACVLLSRWEVGAHQGQWLTAEAPACEQTFWTPGHLNKQQRCLSPNSLTQNPESLRTLLSYAHRSHPLSTSQCSSLTLCLFLPCAETNFMAMRAVPVAYHLLLTD